MQDMKINSEEQVIRQETTLYAKNISKTFGGNVALSNVNLMIKPGEIHGLLGQNGCGKSTLIKVLSGFHSPDQGGELWVNGKAVKLPLQPGEFSKYGMSFVHQDLGLVDTLTVTENWHLNKIALSKSMNIRWKDVEVDARKTFARYNVHIDPNEVVMNLGPVEKAMLSILRAVEEIHNNKAAMEKKRGLLVLDEPTVFLPRTEVDILFNLVRRIADEGISIMFVSHDLDEVMELTNTYTVLRNGANVKYGDSTTSTKEEIIESILGKKLDTYQVEVKDADHNRHEKPVLSVEGLSGNIVRPSQFDVYRGEVLGVTGLVGSGFEEIPYLLFGDVEGSDGQMTFKDSTYDIADFTPGDAVKAKMALIPADRKIMGGALTLTVMENMMMQSMDHYNPRCLQYKKMNEKADVLMDEYEVHPRDTSLEFGQLSGGNQQKVLLAKWIQENPELLILHEPTQGIDIGARQSIYRLIENSVKSSGMTVICSSSDYEQLEQICDRVLILVNGRIIDELNGAEITKERITSLCYETAFKV